MIFLNSLLCGTLGAELATLGTACQNLGEIQKVAFQRIFSSGSTKNKFTTTTGLLKANWEAAIAANDGTKITISPELFGEEKMTPGDAREDAVMLGGIAQIIGSGPTEFSGQFVKEHQKWIAKIKTYAGENLGVWLFGEHGQVGCLVDDQDSPTEYFPIPIKALFVGDLATGNYNRLQYNNMSFKFRPSWSDKFVTFLPTDFDPAFDLVNANS